MAVRVMVGPPLGIFVPVHIRAVMGMGRHHKTDTQGGGVRLINCRRTEQNVLHRPEDALLAAEGLPDPFLRNLLRRQVRIPNQPAIAIEVGLSQQMPGPIGVVADIGNSGNT
ncbi:hypothetical protein D3C87_1774140 [compost metagenome]